MDKNEREKQGERSGLRLPLIHVKSKNLRTTKIIQKFKEGLAESLKVTDHVFMFLRILNKITSYLE